MCLKTAKLPNIIERVAVSMIKPQVKISGWVQEKHLTKHKPRYFVFVDFKKAIQKGSVQKLDITEWLTYPAKCSDTRSSMRKNDKHCQEFSFNVGSHQGPVLSSFLFITAMEALSKESQKRYPWELIYADNMVIMDTILDGLFYKLSTKKNIFKSKGLCVDTKSVYTSMAQL